LVAGISIPVNYILHFYTFCPKQDRLLMSKLDENSPITLSIDANGIYGAWHEITSCSKEIEDILVSFESVINTDFQIAIGPICAEIIIFQEFEKIKELMKSGALNIGPSVKLPVYIPSGNRISVRAKSNYAKPLEISFTLLEQLNE